MSGQSIFIKVKDESEKKDIFDFLIHTKKEVMAKIAAQNTDVFFLIPQEIKGHYLICKFKDSIPAGLLDYKGQLVLQFSSRTEKYLTQVEIKINSNLAFLKINTDLFQLQRREDFRLKLPSNFKSFFEIQNLNSKPTELAEAKRKFTILDLSGGGCRIENPISLLQLKNNDILEGEILIPKRDPIKVTCEVRHVVPVPERDSHQWSGLMFLNLTTISKNKIAAIVMDLYRELFSRMN